MDIHSRRAAGGRLIVVCPSHAYGTVTHHQGYCIVAVASDEPYSATYHLTKDDWLAGDRLSEDSVPAITPSKQMPWRPPSGQLRVYLSEHR